MHSTQRVPCLIIWWYIFQVSFGGIFSGFHLVVYFSGFDICSLLNAAFCDSTTLTRFSTVQHSLRSLFFLQYNTHSVLYSFYSTTLTPFSILSTVTTLTPFSILSTVQHSLRFLFFLQYNTHSVLYSFYSTTLTPFSILSTVQHSLHSLFFLQ